MSIEPREELKILKSIARSLEDISVCLKDIRNDISDLNIQGLVKLVDIVAEQQEIQKLVKQKVSGTDEITEDKDELINDLVRIFITGGFKKCQICHKYTFISNVWKENVCDVCREKYIEKGISKKEAIRIERGESESGQQSLEPGEEFEK